MKIVKSTLGQFYPNLVQNRNLFWHHSTQIVDRFQVQAIDLRFYRSPWYGLIKKSLKSFFKNRV